MSRSLICILMLILFTPVFGRLVKTWTHDELTKAADAIVVIEAVSTKKSDIAPPFASKDLPKENYQAWITTFKVLTSFKGAATIDEPLQILHFTYSDKVNGVTNGACFVKFAIGPLERSTTTTENGVGKGTQTSYKLYPVWLAYLKHREDGRFEPATDHYDAAPSFMELDRMETAFR
ncbi:MAG: hypothetical protein NTV80_11420 [Verrucomicrobia bacterium]|nr:hypothetical protein [Verrucomicrobiota bacterium]